MVKKREGRGEWYNGFRWGQWEEAEENRQAWNPVEYQKGPDRAERSESTVFWSGSSMKNSGHWAHLVLSGLAHITWRICGGAR